MLYDRLNFVSKTHGTVSEILETYLINCIYKHIFYVCMGYHISLLIKNSTAVFYVYILLDLTVFKGDW